MGVRLDFILIYYIFNRLIYRQLRKLYPTAACKQHIQVIEVLEKEGGFTDTEIPQLEDVSRFMKRRSGFQLRPCAGKTDISFFAFFRIYHFRFTFGSRFSGKFGISSISMYTIYSTSIITITFTGTRLDTKKKPSLSSLVIIYCIF
jgi:hypothetical protein